VEEWSNRPENAEGRKTILVVEDEVLIRMTLADDLREAGFKVLEATNADEAMRILRSSDPIDLVATDIDMPSGSASGIELAAQVRSQWPQVKIMIVSGHVATDGPIEAADAVLSKPDALRCVAERARALLDADNDEW